MTIAIPPWAFGAVWLRNRYSNVNGMFPPPEWEGNSWLVILFGSTPDPVWSAYHPLSSGNDYLSICMAPGPDYIAPDYTRANQTNSMESDCPVNGYRRKSTEPNSTFDVVSSPRVKEPG